MLNRISGRKFVFVCVSLLFAGSVIFAGVFRAPRQSPTQQKPQKRVTELPLVISHVPRLKIVSVTVRDADTPNPIAVVEILNKTNLAVTAVQLSTKDEAGDSGAVYEDGRQDPANPYVVIPPHGTKKMEMGFGQMVADAPLILSAATFEDGSEEGDKWCLDVIKAYRKHFKEMKSREGGARP
jgi:hypothetical protein